jgi:pimeloyl-ACP methyl ester carboxylesterase
MQRRTLLFAAPALAIGATPALADSSSPGALAVTASPATQTRHRTVDIDGTEIFYREAGSRDAPAILLLHGFPTSSQMFRNLIPLLADRYRVLAPDYPGFGHSAAPDRTSFAYTFDHYAQLIGKLIEQVGLNRYALYVMDYGAPVGFRIATAHPDRVTALIVQNGNAYDEGIAGFWDPIREYWRTGAAPQREAIRWLTSLRATRWQYTNGVPDVTLLDPDAATLDQALLDRPGNQEIQLDLFYDYRTNLPLYPAWQAYFRERRPPTLVTWGRHDEIFVAAGAEPYKRDIPDAEIHMIDTGHFALETHGVEIAALMRDFMARRVAR